MRGELRLDVKSSTEIHVDYKLTELQEFDPLIIFDAVQRIFSLTELQRLEIAVMIALGGIDKMYSDISTPISQVDVDGEQIRSMLRDLKGENS